MSRIVIICLFATVGLAFAGVALAARRDRSTVPSLAELSGFVMGYQVGRIPVGRIAVLGFWWWVGYHFFAR